MEPELLLIVRLPVPLAVMLLTVRPEMSSLVVTVPAKGKLRSSPDTGAALLCQLPGVDQLVLPPLPVQISVTFVTTWLMGDDVLVVKLLSPPYTAVIVCVATDRVLVVYVIVLPLKDSVPIDVPPSLNITVPAGVPGNSRWR